MTAVLTLVLVFAIQGVLSADDDCSRVMKAKTKDGDSCYECGRSSLTYSSALWSTEGKQDASLGDFPWFAAIYSNKSSEWTLICGGTLISSRALLTAASCVTNEHTFSIQPTNVDDIRVVLGSTQSSWNNISEKKYEVNHIDVHPGYFGRVLKHASDVAVLWLESEVPFSSSVKPACLDFSQSEKTLYKRNAIGYVPGFGYSKECGGLCSELSETLMYSRTEVIHFFQCYNMTYNHQNSDFSLLALDKFCIGNGTASPIQRGDGGGGFTIKSMGLHYVTGVASFKFSSRQLSNGPNSTRRLVYGALTNVSHVIDWLINDVL